MKPQNSKQKAQKIHSYWNDVIQFQKLNKEYNKKKSTLFDWS